MQVKVKGSEQPVAPASEAGSICWICGEVATVEVEIRNPTVIPIKVTSSLSSTTYVNAHSGLKLD